MLRIGMVAPISWRVPPRHYGPWERFVSLLTEGLVARGVDVTLFATADSVTSARLVGTAPRAYSEDPTLNAKAWECLNVAAAFERAAEFDLIHNSADFLPLSYSALVDTPVVTTIHGFSSEDIVPVYARYAERGFYVAISDADRHPALAYLATVHHGIDVQHFPLHDEPAGYLLYFGRIHPDKGTASAIAVARRAGLPLRIAGIVQDQAYFDAEVAPHLQDGRVDYLGSVGPDDRAALLGGATALLHLIDFAEPFGLSVVEAMACGTPVIAHPLGSMPEIIDDGVSGLLVADQDAAVAAVAEAATLDRATVRATAVRRFCIDRMVDEYLEVYARALERWSARRSSRPSMPISAKAAPTSENP